MKKKFKFSFVGQGSSLYSIDEANDSIEKLDKNDTNYVNNIQSIKQCTIQPNKIFLDIGNKLEKGIIDHHQIYTNSNSTSCNSTAGILTTCPEFIFSNINDNSEEIEFVLHSSPDFDCIASAYIARYLIENNQFPDNYKYLIDYAEEIDSGRILFSPDNFINPYAIICVIESVLKKQLGEKNELINNLVLQKGLKLIQYAMENMNKLMDKSLGFKHPAILLGYENEFKDEINLLKCDYEKYKNDLKYVVDRRIQKIRLPLINPINNQYLKEVDALFWNEIPSCELHKIWARQDKTSPSGTGYVFTFIPSELDKKFNGCQECIQKCSQYNIKNSRVIISVNPECGVNIEGLGEQLERKECIKETELINSKGNNLIWRDRNRRRFDEVWCDNEDPWYDGRNSNYTIVDAPRVGSLLSIEEIKNITLNFVKPVIDKGSYEIILPINYEDKYYNLIQKYLDKNGFESVITDSKVVNYFTPYIQEYLFDKNKNNITKHTDLTVVDYFTSFIPKYLFRKNKKSTAKHYENKNICFKSILNKIINDLPESNKLKEQKDKIFSIIEKFDSKEGTKVVIFKYYTGFILFQLNLIKEISFEDFLIFNHFIYDIDQELVKYIKRAIFEKETSLKKYSSFIHNYILKKCISSMHNYKVMCYSNLSIKHQTFNKLEAKELIFKTVNFYRWDEEFCDTENIQKAIKKMFMDNGETTFYGFSKNGGTLITVEYPNLSKNEQRKIKRIKNNYNSIDFNLFLMAAHQKNTLLYFSHKLFQNSIKDRWYAISTLRSRLNNYIAQGYFTQITTNEIGTEFYRSWNGIFDTDQIYKEVCEQLKSVDDYNKVKTSRVTGLWSYILFPIFTVSSLFQVITKIYDYSGHSGVPIRTLGIIIGVVTILFLVSNELLKKLR